MRIAALTAIALLALTGCGGGTETAPGGGPSGSSPAPTSAAPPAAKEYASADLLAAMPRGKEQLHGLKITGQCRTPKKLCDIYAKPGVVGISAEQTGNTYQNLALSVYIAEEPAAKEFAQACTPGPFATEPSENVERGWKYHGTRGINERSQLAIGAWQGHICRSTGTIDTGVQFDRASVGLSNGFHFLEVYADNKASAEAYAREYLDRLEG